MENEIVNKVAQSKLITFNLEDYYPDGPRIAFDIQPWLYEGFMLKEKEFRAYVNAHNWSQYKDAYVAVYCATEAIVPGWAYMLIAVKLAPYAKRTVKGSLEDLESLLYQDALQEVDMLSYKDKLVIIKGCSSKPVPLNAYMFIAEKLQGVAKSVMYGEACSSVPLFKRK